MLSESWRLVEALVRGWGCGASVEQVDEETEKEKGDEVSMDLSHGSDGLEDGRVS